MKIIEIINSLEIKGGAEIFFINLCINMKKNGHDVVIISLFDKVHSFFENKIKEHELVFFVCNKKKGFDFSAARLLKKIITSQEPNIVHMHLSCLPSYFLAFGLKKQKWKLFETFHSEPGKDCSLYSELFRKLFIKFKKIHFIGISDEITNIATNVYKSIKCSTIYNGIPFPEITLKNSDDPQYDFVIAAAFTEVKNHKFLFKCFSKVVNEYPSSKLLCLGTGPLFNECLTLINDLNISKNIVLAGEVENVYDFYNDCFCFILTSKREGNPLSILEAMSFGMPIIAPKLGGIPDIVDERNGILYEPDNQESLIRAMNNILLNKNTFNKMGKNNIKAVNKYSIKTCVDEYISLFSK